MKDYFNILGVQPNASEDEIRSAYKKLAMKHHPDRGGDQAAFQDVQEAYSTLTDPGKRQQWEQQRAFSQNGPGNFGFSFNFGPDINDIFNQFHGGSFFGHGFGKPAKNRDIRIAMNLSLEETLSNHTKYVEIREPSGTRTVQVNVPRGVQPGMQMRFAGHGDHSQPNLPPGDLFVEFRINPHPEFVVSDLNIIKSVTINAIDAIIGTNITVRGLDRKEFNVKIPAGTQPGTMMSLGAQGLYNINNQSRGELLLEISIEIPKSITSDQLEQLKRMV